MKVFLIVVVVLVAKANAWFWSRNEETTATADGRGIDESCVAAARDPESCEFFDCFEQRLPCGWEFYMQRFGNHYCNRFQRYRETFTEAGQQFLMNSQQCVKERLLEYYRRDYVNCHRLEHNAIAMISPCYIDNGFCDIIVENSQQFIEVFEFNDLFRGGSGKLWRELFGLARHCGGRAFTNFVSATTARFNPLRSLFGNDDK